MLNDDDIDRTLPPTERRRQEARKRGDVPRSSPLTSAMILLAASFILWSLIPTSANPISTLMRDFLTQPTPTSLTISSTFGLIEIAMRAFVMTVGPVLIVLLVSGIVANLLQVGWQWNTSTVIPRIRVIRLFSWDRAAQSVELLLKLGVLGGITWQFLLSHDWRLRLLAADEPSALLFQPVRMVGELCIRLSMGLVLIALVDYGYQFWRHEQRLKMSVEELRREQKDDAAKAQIKQRQNAGAGSSQPISDIRRIEP